MKFYTVFEGRHANDSDLDTDFRSMTRAIHYAKRCKSNYVVVHEYTGCDRDHSDYTDTVYERENESIKINKEPQP